MQSTIQSMQAQHIQALTNARENFSKAFGESQNNMVSQLTKATPKQIEEIITSWLNSINCDIQIVRDAIKDLEESAMGSINASKSLHDMVDEFHDDMEVLLTNKLAALKTMEEEEISGFEAELRILAKDLQTHCNQFKDSVGKWIMNIIPEIKDVDDIEAVSTQEARTHLHNQKSEKMLTRSQAARKRKAEPQSLEDEPVSSKCKSDAQPAVSGSADEPDTTLSSATVSSAESKVGMFPFHIPNPCNIL